MVPLQKRWETGGHLPTEGIQVNGDSGNDAELFEVPGVYGCVVSNAMPELAAWADAHPSDMLFRCVPGQLPVRPVPFYLPRSWCNCFVLAKAVLP